MNISHIQWWSKCGPHNDIMYDVLKVIMMNKDGVESNQECALD